MGCRDPPALMTLTAMRAWRSFSLSLRMRCCSALSALRCSCRRREPWLGCPRTFLLSLGIPNIPRAPGTGLLLPHLHMGGVLQQIPNPWAPNLAQIPIILWQGHGTSWVLLLQRVSVLFAHEGDGLPTYDPVFEGDELFFLLLPALKVGFNEGLQLIQVLLHALAVDVLHQTEMKVMAVLTVVKPSGSCWTQQHHSAALRCTHIEIQALTIRDFGRHQVGHEGPER